MKYLKHYEKFNLFKWGKKRKKLTDKERYALSFDIKEFCDDYLSYLIDKDYTVSIENSFDRKTMTFIMFMNNDNMYSNTWGYVSDHFLPFVEMFIKEYGIDGDITIWLNDNGGEYSPISIRPGNIKIVTTVDDFILNNNEHLKDDSIVTNISFNIKVD